MYHLFDFLILNDIFFLFVAEGDVYMWGGGSEGQLGLGDVEEAPAPVRLPIEEEAVCVACGYYHTAVVTGRYA